MIGQKVHSVAAQEPLGWRLIVLLVLPGVVNDFLYLAFPSFVSWLVIDYGTRVVAIALVFSVAAYKPWRQSALRFPPALVTICFFVLAWFVAQVDLWFFGEFVPTLYTVAPRSNLFSHPILPPDVLFYDLVFGVPLAAFSEELIFWGVIGNRLVFGSNNKILGAVASVAIFTAAHWSYGFASLVFIAVSGSLFFGLFLLSRSIWPGIFSHWLVDLTYEILKHEAAGVSL